MYRLKKLIPKIANGVPNYIIERRRFFIWSEVERFWASDDYYAEEKFMNLMSGNDKKHFFIIQMVCKACNIVIK